MLAPRPLFLGRREGEEGGGGEKGGGRGEEGERPWNKARLM